MAHVDVLRQLLCAIAQRNENLTTQEKNLVKVRLELSNSVDRAPRSSWTVFRSNCTLTYFNLLAQMEDSRLGHYRVFLDMFGK